MREGWKKLCRIISVTFTHHHPAARLLLSHYTKYKNYWEYTIYFSAVFSRIRAEK